MPKWPKGKSGNKRGRPAGSRDRRTDSRLALLRSNEPELLQKLVELALAGDMHALRLIADRMWPRLRSESRPLRLPDIADAESLSEQAQALIARGLSGEFAPEALQSALAAVYMGARIVETSDLEERLQRLEREQGHSQQWLDRLNASRKAKAKTPRRRRVPLTLAEAADES